MKTLIAAAAFVAIASAVAPSAHAVGCVSGGVVGGVAGHMVGHGVAGAAVGCAVGHHQNTVNRRRADDAAANRQAAHDDGHPDQR